MISFEMILLECGGLQEAELRRWIENNWVRPLGPPERYEFHEIDLARVKLILELRDMLEVNEPALPAVLSLLDQLYEMRRHMHRLNRALEKLPPDVRGQLLDYWEG